MLVTTLGLAAAIEEHGLTEDDNVWVLWLIAFIGLQRRCGHHEEVGGDAGVARYSIV